MVIHHNLHWFLDVPAPSRNGASISWLSNPPRREARGFCFATERTPCLGKGGTVETRDFWIEKLGRCGEKTRIPWVCPTPKWWLGCFLREWTLLRYVGWLGEKQCFGVAKIVAMEMLDWGFHIVSIVVPLSGIFRTIVPKASVNFQPQWLTQSQNWMLWVETNQFTVSILTSRKICQNSRFIGEAHDFWWFLMVDSPF